MKKPVLHYKAGFTVIELMAATAVFALMMAFTAQMVGRTTQIATQTTKQIEASGGVQVGLDAIARDLRYMVRTQGFSVIALNSDGASSDQIAFLSIGRPRTTGSTPRYIALQYLIGTSGTPTSSGTLANPGLVRIENTVSWSDNVNAQLIAAANASAIATNTDLISDRVFRMEIVYVWKDGTVSKDIPTAYQDSRYSGGGAGVGTGRRHEQTQRDRGRTDWH